MGKVKVIKGHVATIGYEDSNPFSLVNWASRCSTQGYTEVVEMEFSIALITKEDYETYIRGISMNSVVIDDSAEGYETDIGVLIQPISPMSYMDDGCIEVTQVQGL